MPRAPRIEFAGAIYHLMNRGDHLESIFEDDKDREVFLKTLEETCVSSGWQAHSFVLMGNHYHLLIETTRPTLVKGMQYLNSTYTARYNARHKTRGHLFQGRYKALLVDGEAGGYFLTVSDYIHLNPARMKGKGQISNVKDLLEDRWSSAGWLAGSRKGKPEWLRWERVYGELGLGKWRSSSRRAYREHLERRIREVSGEEESWRKIRRGWLLGSEEFAERMKERLEELSAKPHERDSWAGEAVEEREQDRARKLLVEGTRRLGMESPSGGPTLQRYLLARWVRTRTRVGTRWLAGQLGFESVGTLSYGLWHVGQQMETDRKIQRRWKLLDSYNPKD
ncbi:MAG: transposase [Terrimicrobiaceae bacterium]|nr:transposase [Terrimicrobiaceae bacterium]